MNADEIRDRIRDTPRDIKVLCLRGHFIADVWLEVPDGDDAIAMWPRGPHKRDVFNRHAGFYGFWMSIARSNVLRRELSDRRSVQRWKCTNAGCDYSGRFDYAALALKLAAAAIAGQSEYRLTT